jgi:DNA-binding beta-propeller fold protein YncE/mono/diheme cytochrome c family protein
MRAFREQLLGLLLLIAFHGAALADGVGSDAIDRGPVDLVLNRAESWLISANEDASTLSLVDVATGEVLEEVLCTAHPTSLALSADEQFVFATGTHGGALQRFRVDGKSLVLEGEVQLGFEPRGVAVTPDGATAYVALTAASAVAEVDLTSLVVRRQIPCGRWPRSVALGPNGRLAVACSGSGGVSVIDTAKGELAFEENFVGLNLGQLALSPDGADVYFPWVAYGANPISKNNIQQGWVIASRIGRVALEKKQRRKAIALDPRGKAVGDPTGMALTSDGEWMITSAAGTHELLVFKLPGLGFHDYGGPGDHIDPAVLADDQRFFRIEVGGRPLALRMSQDNRHVYVANALLNTVQVVDLQERKLARSIELGGPETPSLAKRGEAIFYDAGRSLDQWYSCHTCHWEGGTNSVTMDTENDNTVFTFKTVLPLRNVAKSGPWTWHGWQEDLQGAMKKSLTDTMQGPAPTDEDAEAVLAFLATLDAPPNSYRQADGSLSPEAERGRAIFSSAEANCIQCHTGELATDGQIHDVGTGGDNDWYEGYNTPSLLGVHRKVLLLHDGRAKSLEQLLTGRHSPEKVAGTRKLTPEEVADLVAYLRTL